MPESQIGYLDRVTRETLALLPEPTVVLSSVAASWNSVIVEQFHLPPLELPENVTVSHLITLKLSSPSLLEWKEGPRVRSRMFLPGDVCVTPSEAPRSLRWEADVELLVMALTPEFLFHTASELPHQPRIELLQTHGEPDAQIQYIGMALKSELESGGSGGRLFADSLATALAVRLLSRYNGFSLAIPEYTTGLSASALRRTIEYIQENLHEDISLKDLADLLQMSMTRFKTTFKQSTGMAPHEYIIVQRVERARHLLRRGDLSPGQVAIRVGFYDQSHLNRHFKRLVGVTPGSYLRRS